MPLKKMVLEDCMFCHCAVNKSMYCDKGSLNELQQPKLIWRFTLIEQSPIYSNRAIMQISE